MTGDEMQRAIEFLLNNQANFEERTAETIRRWDSLIEELSRGWDSRFEESIRRWDSLLEELNRHWETRFEELNRHWDTRFEELNRQWDTRFEEVNRQWDTRFEVINGQITQTNQVVGALADTQNSFTQTVIGFVNSQNKFNTSFLTGLAELAEAQQRTEHEISDLAGVVNNFISFSSGNGDSPRE